MVSEQVDLEAAEQAQQEMERLVTEHGELKLQVEQQTLAVAAVAVE
jgi:hypothetical protein